MSSILVGATNVQVQTVHFVHVWMQTVASAFDSCRDYNPNPLPFFYHNFLMILGIYALLDD
jgi:hypothetical protein